MNSSAKFATYFWKEEVQNGLDEIDNAFFYDIYERSTFAGASPSEAGKWGLMSAQTFVEYMKAHLAEYLSDREAWFKRNPA